ncbi:MAG: periplasmic binding protein [Caulobacter sp.]|nr:periplasmic binding protein [Caulobacter sp.]
MTGATRRAAIAGAAALGLSGSAIAAPAAPRRVVSLNPCLDVILLNVADRGQIAALSHYAREPDGSTIVAEARTLPFTWETAEEVIGLRPDLVLTARHSSPATRNALSRLHVATELFDVPNSVAESLAQVERLAGLVGRPERGRRLVARIEAALAANTVPSDARRLDALIYQPNGFAGGAGTLVDALMTRAGFNNVAGRYGLRKWGNVPLEQLLADPPQVLLIGEAAPGSIGWGDRVMTHPALRALKGKMRQARFPERLLYCGGPVMIQTIETLAAARRTVLEAMA